MNSSKQIFLTLYFRFRNLILYGIIGGFSACIDFLIFYTLSNILDFYYVVANIISVTIGISISFILNKSYNFKVKDKVLKRFIIFFSIGFGGLLLSTALLYLFIDFLSLDKIISKILSIILVVLIQFVLNKFITFKK